MWVQVKDRRINFDLINEYRVEKNVIELEGIDYDEDIEFKTEEDAKEAAKIIDEYIDVMVKFHMFFSRR